MTGDGILIVGGGLASQRCVETLRARGYEGRIADGLRRARAALRPPAALQGAARRRASEESEVGFRPAGWYADQRVELLFGAAPWGSTPKRRRRAARRRQRARATRTC